MEVAEDTHGLHYRSTIPNTSAGRDVAVYLEQGMLEGSSFRFSPINGKESVDSYDEETGLPVRTVREAKLIECSPVYTPAYLSSTVNKRSFTAIAEFLELDLDVVYETAMDSGIRSLIEHQSVIEADDESSRVNTATVVPSKIALMRARLDLNKINLR